MFPPDCKTTLHESATDAGTNEGRANLGPVDSRKVGRNGRPCAYIRRLGAQLRASGSR